MASFDRDRAGAPGATSAGQDLLLLFARVALGAIFVQSGFGKVTGLGGFIGGLGGMGLPMPVLLGVAGTAVEFLGGVAIVLGAWTRAAALLVAAFTVAATLVAHRFWAVPAEQQAMQSIQFMKNLAIIGGLLALTAAGSGKLAIDALRRRR